MVQSKNITAAQANNRGKGHNRRRKSNKYKKFASMGRVSVGIINELDSPIDSINRFINLALQTIGEGSQSRQFLLESKQGIRETARLLKRLNNYAKKMEKEFREIAKR
jgi:hypothetical protein